MFHYERIGSVIKDELVAFVIVRCYVESYNIDKAA